MGLSTKPRATTAPEALVHLELAGYNGPGPWVFQLIRRDTALPLTSTPGITVDACTDGVPRDACAEGITVSIDIKPGSSPNRINPKSNGVIPVGILTTDAFDATTVDPLQTWPRHPLLWCGGKSAVPRTPQCSEQPRYVEENVGTDARCSVREPSRRI
jgi:hypothetical protein